MLAMKHDPRSILIINALPFGQALACVPALRALRQAYPKTLLTAAVTKGLGELLTVYQLADKIIELGVIHSANQGFLNALGRSARLLTKTRGEEFDLALDFAPGVETQLIARLAMGVRTLTPVNLADGWERLRGRGSQPTTASNAAARCASVLRQLGITVEDPRTFAEVPAEENARFEQLLTRNKSRGGEPIAVLHSALSGRGWPIERFGELALLLANNFSARVVASDDPYRRGFTNALNSALPKGAIKLSAPRAIELLAAMARASIFVTDDAGLAQVATDLGAPTLEIAETRVPQAAAINESAPAAFRVVEGASCVRITTEEVFEAACAVIQVNRSSLLFQR